MPFITPQDRLRVEIEGPRTVGDLCYIAYKEMVQQWKENPRWTTAHTIYRSLHRSSPIDRMTYNHSYFEWTDGEMAVDLAWQVFFQNYVMPYEREKEKENGTI